VPWIRALNFHPLGPATVVARSVFRASGRISREGLINMSDIVSGVIKRARKGAFVLRDPSRSFRPGPHDTIVPGQLVRNLELPEGAVVKGPAVHKAGRPPRLTAVESICGLSPEQFRKRTPYNRLIAIPPTERFDLSACGDESMRIVDLIAPIGKGTRGLIVSPAKAGKTMMLQKIANAIACEQPETRIIVLLIDERPEEVTLFRRSVQAEVIASSIDQSTEQHVELAELMLANIRVELECGHDVVVLVDSITRMGRVFNLRGRGNGRTLSGGLGAGAMEIPRRFFGLARNIEDGGSVTIIATALVDTGSRMDQLIFEEFKGTGNSEIILDRGLAESRIFPAINLPASGTRMEERLYKADQSGKLASLRRALAGHSPGEAIQTMLEILKKYPTNEELLRILPESAP